LNKLRFKRENLLGVVPYLACIAPLALYQALYVNGFYPVTEGWFSEYAHLIRGGEVPYRDFSLLLMPLYPLQIATFQAMFGEGFFALHILGIVVTCGIAMALLDLLRAFFNPWISAFAAAAAMIYYESGVAFLGYDFTQFVTLYLLIATALLVRSLKPPPATGCERNALLLCAGSGFFAAASILIKQSNGGITSVVLAVAGIVAASFLYRPRCVLFRAAAMALGVCVPIAAVLVWLAATGALPAFVSDAITAAATAKGGLNILAWAGFFFKSPVFWPATRQAMAELVVLVFYMLLAAAVLELAHLAFTRSFGGWRQLRPAMERIAGVARTKIKTQAIFVSILTLGTLCLLIAAIARGDCGPCESLRTAGSTVKDSFYYWGVNFYIVGFIAGFALLIWTRRAAQARFFTVASFGVGLMFGNGASAGLSEISMFVGVAILIAFLMEIWLPYVVPALLPAVVALSFCVYFVGNKFESPYAWWQVVVPPVRNTACADTRGSLLQGVCLSPNNYAKITRIRDAIVANSGATDQIYVYPHMPIFYLLSNRPPFDGAVVTWFDFTSDSLANDVSRRLLSDTPRVIVLAEIPDSVLRAHEHLFRNDRPLVQRKILRAIGALRKAGRLRLADREPDLDGLAVDVFVKQKR